MNRKFIEGLANSSKLKYTEADIADWETQLLGVFAWIDKMQEVDTSKVVLKNTERKMLLRQDEVITFPDTVQLVSDFKDAQDNMARVKKVL